MPNIFPFYEAEPFWLKRAYGSGGSGDDGGSGGTKFGRLVDIYMATEEDFADGFAVQNFFEVGTAIGESSYISHGFISSVAAGLTVTLPLGNAYSVYAAQMSESVISSSRLIEEGVTDSYVIPDLPSGETLLFVGSGEK